MNKYIYKFFESKEESIEYLIQKLCTEDVSPIIRNQDTGEIEMLGFQNNDQLKRELFTTIIKSMYGRNITTMANYFYSEDIFKNSIEKHILKYLELRGIKAEVVHINASSITTRYLIHKTINDTDFAPISRWSPNEKWDVNMAYGKHADINLLNPINQCDSAHIVIKSDNFEKFANDAYKYGFEVQLYTKGGIVKALPAKSSAIMIKLVQLIHKHF